MSIIDDLGGLGSVIGGIGSLIGVGNNLANSSSARDAASAAVNNSNTQSGLAKLNSDRLFQLATAGTTDANGNQVFYDPTTNSWQTKMSPIGQQLLTATNQGKLQNASMRGSENVGATAALGKLNGPSMYGNDPNAYVGKLAEAGTIGLNQAYQPVINAAVTNSMRTGSSASPILASLASRMSQDYTANQDQAFVQGNKTFQDLKTGEQNNNMNLFTGQADRASNVDNAPMPAANATAASGAAGQGASVANSGLTGANAGLVNAGQIFGANMPGDAGFGQAGTILGSMINRYNGNRSGDASGAGTSYTGAPGSTPGNLRIGGTDGY